MSTKNARLNVDQHRARIDRGEEGDKVPGFDPAAAPMGTDEEAAGTPTPPHAARPTGDVRPPSGLNPAPRDSIAPDASPAKGRAGASWAIAVVLAVIVVALACFYAFSGGMQG